MKNQKQSPQITSDIINSLPDLPKSSGRDVQALTGRHHEILRLHAMGTKHKDIAKLLDVSSVTVHNIVNSTLGQLRLAELFESMSENALDAHQLIMQHQEAAAKTLIDALNANTPAENPDWRARLQAADKLLTKGEHPDKRATISKKEVHLKVSMALERIKAAANESGALQAEELKYQEVTSESDATDEESLNG
jgi:predicted DNA-binding protein (UPF0251 family)